MSTDRQTIDATELDWTKPGPGTWRLDRSHYEPHCARLSQRAIVHGMATGMAEGFARMGSPLKGMEAAFVNGNFYYRLVPLVASDRDLPSPPAPVLWLLTRIHPAFRAAARTAARSLAEGVWNEELRQWEEVHKPYLVETCGRLGALDPSAMDDSALADHLTELIDLLDRSTALHFRLHVSDLGPIGLLLVRAREWGLDAVEVMASLTGASPATSAPAVALAEIRTATEGHGPFADLDEIRAVSDRAAALLDDFLQRFGWRLTTGYDLQDLTLAELPELTVTAINAGHRSADPARAAGHGDAALERLRQQLDPADHGELERLVADARALYGLRDENGPLTYQWPAGLLRRALLEAGRRLLDRHRLSDARQVFDLAADELTSLVTGGPGPSVTELEGRLAQRLEWARHRAPEQLGPDDPPPPRWTLPGPLAEIMDVVLTVLDLIESRDIAPTLDGIGIGDEPCIGRARVVTDEFDALARLEPGDVLIAPFTVPTYNAVLASAGAVVVENGGLLCHAAVIAREFGIAGLVGVSGVTERIADGALVCVDPVAGTIRELASPVPQGP